MPKSQCFLVWLMLSAVLLENLLQQIFMRAISATSSASVMVSLLPEDGLQLLVMMSLFVEEVMAVVAADETRRRGGDGCVAWRGSAVGAAFPSLCPPSRPRHLLTVSPSALSRAPRRAGRAYMRRRREKGARCESAAAWRAQTAPPSTAKPPR